MNDHLSTKPFISICIPAYKRADYLDRLLKSVAEQTFKNFEVIITDDSPDETVSLLAQSYQKQLPIHYQRNPQPLGTPENWNEGIRLANGKWIKIMHDDDWFTTPYSLKRFVKLIENNPKADFLFSGSLFVRNNQVYGGMHTSFWEKLLLKNPTNLYYKNFIGPPSVVIHKHKNVYYDSKMKWLVDVDFYIRFMQSNPFFTFTKDPLVSVGYSADQVTEAVFHDKSVFVKENLMILQKLPHSILRRIWNYDYTWRMIRNFKIKHVEELQQLYPEAQSNIPQQHVAIINFQRHIPSGLLKVGLLSKLLMFISYIKSGWTTKTI